MRESISPAERLAVTLRFLATGEQFTSLAFNFRIRRFAISKIITETCEALYKVLKEKYLSVPSTESAWQGIAKQFEELWQFPRCIGALDSKHITIQPPKNSGSHYYNYKGTNSIVLMALVDADLKFLYADVGTNGRVSDGGVWNKCTLSQALQDNSLHLPQPSALPLCNDPVPYMVVAEEAFGLKKWIMKPYPQIQLNPENCIFNYRLSRARRCVENAFGILANRWRVFRSTIALAPEKVSHLVLDACALHNYLRTQNTSRQIFTPSDSIDFEDVQTGQIIPGQWRTDIPTDSMYDIVTVGSNNYFNDAKTVRDAYRKYFNSDIGAVSWQKNMLH
ncbi:UNVERIFIED_CONTAM: hypothetical protein FKN15_007788 [Acipenser sinensis]